MRILSDKRCIIGEGPIWNADEGRLYFTNAYGEEVCMLDWESGALTVRPVPGGAAAFAFDTANRLIVSRGEGVFYLNENGACDPLYDPQKYEIRHANDMKVGPDGRIYVGTQSSRRLGLSDELDGNLYIACWGQGHLAVADTRTMQITDHIPVPARIPASCGFAGPDMHTLVIVTASLRAVLAADPNAGFTFAEKMPSSGRLPYRFVPQ